MDFTLKICRELLMTFIDKGYEFFTFEGVFDHHPPSTLD